ncbi:TOBE domain-containing protein, partial [Streptomyces sp. NPDC059082]|uniref:TOBE domain-containing protein n=1 Tax=Streptomyces sp. NPDC059082 TaxID=3346720 RepID=UPI0036C9FEC5
RDTPAHSAPPRAPAPVFAQRVALHPTRLPRRVLESGRVARAGRARPVDGDVPTTSDVEVLVRPENVTVTADPDGEAVIVSTSFFGSVTRVHLDHRGTPVKADLPSRDASELTPGTRATVGLAPHPVLVVPAARP